MTAANADFLIVLNELALKVLSVLVITPDTDIVRKAKMIPQAPIETGHPLYMNKCGEL